jgi:hypothetical protein
MSGIALAAPASSGPARELKSAASQCPARFAYLVFALTITLGFFWEGMRADFSAISGDQVNILTICIKKDRPELLKGDLIAGDPRSTAYYTPLFVSRAMITSGVQISC